MSERGAVSSDCPDKNLPRPVSVDNSQFLPLDDHPAGESDIES